MTTTHGVSARDPPTFLSMCCAPFTSCFPTSKRGRSKSLSTSSISWPLERTSDQDLLIEQDIDEKSAAASIIRDQPSLQVSPEVGYQEAHPQQGSSEKYGGGFEKRHKLNKSYASSRTSVSVRKGRRSDLSSRGRPRISGPTNFIHISSGTPEGPIFNPQARPNPPQRRASLERLELSIYQPANRLSAMLPHFDFTLPSAPSAAYIRDSQLYDGSATYTRKYSITSFHVPRRGLDSSPPSTDDESIPPLVPRKALGRARAYTSPDSARRIESIASGLNEIDRLKQRIDEVIERQSLYIPSRPGTPHSMAQTMPDLATESLPDIPALPPSAPSFAERLKDDIVRPQTAPLNTATISSPTEARAHDDATDTFVPSPISPVSPYRNMPPPLPLVLRPPLRKKKSFSVVSNWLKSPGHSRHISMESVTNVPRPVKGTDGFYQCVPAGGSYSIERRDSFGTVETWDSDYEEDEEERGTKATTYSQGGTPVKRPAGAGMAQTQTNGTFGRGERR